MSRHRNYGFSPPPERQEGAALTCLIAAATIIVMGSTLGYAIYLAMRMHGHV